MPVVKITRAGVRSAPREVPTDKTATVLPMTVDRVGLECAEDEQPTKVSSLGEAFAKFKPKLHFTMTIDEEGTELVAEIEFKSLQDFDPKKIRSHEAGKRNDLAALQSRIDLLHDLRERFAVLSVKHEWDNTDRRRDILHAVAEFEGQLRNIASGERAAT